MELLNLFEKDDKDDTEEEGSRFAMPGIPTSGFTVSSAR